MKRIVYALMATVTGLVLLFSYRTSLEPEPASALADAPTAGGAAVAPPTTGTPSESASPAPSSAASSSASAAPAATPSSSSGLADGTWTGQAANTRYGPVQVRITVSGGTITDVQVPQYPSESGRDQQINSRALPILVQQTMTAQSAQVDMVSGATYTSTGYRTSLQSALDQARS
ncbi:FMN-binding protein [Microbacterium sp. HMWF026]|uniref:FMN-binding protein n=1 Tax=Microbacterium sp. HMWF026 TaxID=2056861 RepID=UPI000D394B51|nr:FMN-binding protein [Microbacterium sp. HMWF026]PTT17413.1 FMN-binding protein [Microbacterium sp. HMWF026]